MKQLILLLSLAAILLSCKKTDSTPTNPTTNKDTTQTSIAKYGAGVTDIDGNKYKTVIIGTQEWMGENLKVSKYNDGTYIPQILNYSSSVTITTPSWNYYKNSDSIGNIYGVLYNWYTVETNKVCPLGWHVPSNNEISKLFHYLGSGDSIPNGPNPSSWRYNNIGLKLKEVGLKHWRISNNGNNSSLFNALPGGYRTDDGTYSSIGQQTNWWSSTSKSLNSAWFFGLIDYNFDDVTYIENYPKGSAGSYLRCIKD